VVWRPHYQAMSETDRATWRNAVAAMTIDRAGDRQLVSIMTLFANAVWGEFPTYVAGGANLMPTE